MFCGKPADIFLSTLVHLLVNVTIKLANHVAATHKMQKGMQTQSRGSPVGQTNLDFDHGMIGRVR